MSKKGWQVARFNLLDQFRMGLAILRLIKDPTQTLMVFRIADIVLKMKDRRALDKALDYGNSQENFRSVRMQGAVLNIPDLEALLALPKDTLGFKFASHMKKNNLSLDFYPDVDPSNDTLFFEKRARQSHDIWHVLCDYDVDVKGELELQAFTLGNIRVGLSAVILGAGIFHILRNKPEEIFEYFSAIATAFQRGRQAEYLLGMAFDQMWEKPLSEVRSLAGLSA